ncbi:MULTISPECIES: TadE/TadG family type IV pilus assembly protein [unclassified Sphingobium]|uniref:TadE/TadG family type IV pilus assembly protein n=1 Tax=unclassified Sphingobium TaxID=2611147 RepID=UPI0022256E4A|nr:MULTISPECIES: TadE/TadG family type IV pilus assembly protein [unclassified Sphingobium]MCW2394655.1 Flp pilus assembly pilin Flp [Sphingobium sp. B8D3B]MCW2418169.1 Flp pilus assembly pilin Flp [Sphingobium sp. B8D3C]
MNGTTARLRPRRKGAPHGFLARLIRAHRGVAAVEFALTAPLILGLFLAGAELTNFAITRMRVSQIALHVADNASRIGTNQLNAPPLISESQINDLLIGANMQSGSLDLATNGRIIISSLEPVANPNPEPKKFRIHWQRCFGAKNWTSTHGVQGDTDLPAMGETGKQVTAPDGGSVIFVEVAYDYTPLISASIVPTTVIVDTAAMTVRDDRDYDGNGGTGVANNENVAASTCSS